MPAVTAKSKKNAEKPPSFIPTLLRSDLRH